MRERLFAARLHSRKECRRMWGERVDVLLMCCQRPIGELGCGCRQERSTQVWRLWLCAQAKEGAADPGHDVPVWDRVTESGHLDLGSYNDSPPAHLDAISRPVVFALPLLLVLHSSIILCSLPVARQLYIGQRRARFTFSQEKRRWPTTQHARFETAAPPRTVKRHRSNNTNI